jgi:hypothetical protein
MGFDPFTLHNGNSYANSQMKPGGETNIASDLPHLLYCLSKPSWFDNLPWPAFNPQSPNYNLEAIPAEYRYLQCVTSGRRRHSAVQRAGDSIYLIPWGRTMCGPSLVVRIRQGSH